MQEIQQLLMDREDTCFSLQVIITMTMTMTVTMTITITITITITMTITMIIALNGTFQLDGSTLNNFAELKTVEGLKEGSLVKVARPGSHKYDLLVATNSDKSDCLGQIMTQDPRAAFEGPAQVN